MRAALILDFDFFTAIGGGQTFYRRVVERNSALKFLYPSRGPDLTLKAHGGLPNNAHPFLYNPRLEVGAVTRTLSSCNHWAHTHYANQIARVAVSIQGMTLQIVDVPSFFPAAHLVRPLLSSYGIMVERVALGLLGWPSESAKNAYENEITPDVLTALSELERASVEASDVRYTISNQEAALNSGTDLPVVVLEMHDAMEAIPLPAEEPPNGGPPDLWYVGRLDGAKGTDLFIELASRMPRHLYSRCMFTGPDNDWAPNARWSDRLLSLARERGLEVTYSGTKSDADLRSSVYTGRTVLVVPSRNDAFNYVALEGVLNGCPVLLSENTGVFGFLRDNYPHLLPRPMRPDDLDTAAERLQELLANYPTIARERRAVLRRKPFPQPSSGFMEPVYGAQPVRSAKRQDSIGTDTSAARSGLALLTPEARNWRRRRERVSDPKVTVIVPTLDRPELLAPTLACLTQQTLDALEVIVVDDGSKDATTVRRVAEGFGSFVRYLRIGNVGEAGAVNRGISAARAKYVSFLSDDDAFAPELLSEAVAILDLTPDAIGAYPDWDIVDTAGGFVEAHRVPAFDRHLMIACHWCLPGPGTVVRRDILNLIGGRDLSFRYVSDFDLWLRATSHGSMVHIARKLAYWRLHGSNLTTSDRRLQMAAERIRLIDRLFMDSSEQDRGAKFRATAYAAAHLAAAAILGEAEPEVAAGHLKRAKLLDPGLLDNLPPNMAGYPAIWPNVIDTSLPGRGAGALAASVSEHDWGPTRKVSA